MAAVLVMIPDVRVDQPEEMLLSKDHDVVEQLSA